MILRAIICGIMAAMTIAPSSPTAADYTPHGIIYKATSPSGKCYIGQTTQSIVARIRQHYADTKSGTAFANALCKYGWRIEWEVLSWHRTQAALDAAEVRAIAKHRAAGIILYNIKEGGRGGKHAPETCAKMSAYHTGRKRTPETCARIAAAKMGGKHSAETRRKMSAGQRRYLARKRQRETGMLI